MRCEREALRPFHMTLRLSQSEARISAASFWASRQFVRPCGRQPGGMVGVGIGNAGEAVGPGGQGARLQR